MAAAGMVVALASSVQAGNITLVGGTAGVIPSGTGVNDYVTSGLFAGPVIGGYYGSQISIDISTPSLTTIQFFGAEAGFNNEFNFEKTELFDHPGGTIISPNLLSPLGTFSTTALFGSGLLSFSFDVNGDASSVANGSNPDDSAGAAIGPNFFATCDPFGTSAGSGGTTCNSIFLFLDDGGAGPDDNHDDFLVQITISEIPEPGSMALLGSGLIGLGMLARRFKR